MNKHCFEILHHVSVIYICVSIYNCIYNPSILPSFYIYSFLFSFPRSLSLSPIISLPLTREPPSVVFHNSDVWTMQGDQWTIQQKKAATVKLSAEVAVTRAECLSEVIGEGCNQASLLSWMPLHALTYRSPPTPAGAGRGSSSL